MAAVTTTANVSLPGAGGFWSRANRNPYVAAGVRALTIPINYAAGNKNAALDDAAATGWMTAAPWALRQTGIAKVLGDYPAIAIAAGSFDVAYGLTVGAGQISHPETWKPDLGQAAKGVVSTASVMGAVSIAAGPCTALAGGAALATGPAAPVTFPVVETACITGAAFGGSKVGSFINDIPSTMEAAAQVGQANQSLSVALTQSKLNLLAHKIAALGPQSAVPRELMLAAMSYSRMNSMGMQPNEMRAQFGADFAEKLATVLDTAGTEREIVLKAMGSLGQRPGIGLLVRDEATNFRAVHEYLKTARENDFAAKDQSAIIVGTIVPGIQNSPLNAEPTAVAAAATPPLPLTANTSNLSELKAKTAPITFANWDNPGAAEKSNAGSIVATAQPPTKTIVAAIRP